MFDTLVLSGGSTKGFYLLGALQAFLDLDGGCSFKNYVGCSVGSILCYLLIIGYTPTEILVELCSHTWLESIHINVVSLVSGSGFTSFSPIKEALEDLTLKKLSFLPTMKDLDEKYGKKLYCTTYNMSLCKTEYISVENYPDLPCLNALRMSCNIPLVFDRYMVNSCYYIDGGFTHNFPIKFAEQIGEKILGIYLNVDESSLRDDPESSIGSYIFKLLQIPVVNTMKNEINSITDKSTVVAINSGEYQSILNFNISLQRRLRLFSSGYTQLKEYFQKAPLSCMTSLSS